MYSLESQKVLSKKRYAEEEDWEYIEEGTLKISRSARVCMTCTHFRYACDKHCHTLLACNAHQSLIPQGSHLTCKCPHWHKNFEDQYHFCPEVA